jgi:hypothetical protein
VTPRERVEAAAAAIGFFLFFLAYLAAAVRHC